MGQLISMLDSEHYWSYTIKVYKYVLKDDSIEKTAMILQYITRYFKGKKG